MFFILADGKPFAKIELSNNNSNNKKTGLSNLTRDTAIEETSCVHYMQLDACRVI